MAHYVKTKDSPQFWFINDDGEKTAVNHKSELAGFGWPLLLEHVTADELEKIPNAGKKKRQTKKDKDTSEE